MGAVLANNMAIRNSERPVGNMLSSPDIIVLFSPGEGAGRMVARIMAKILLSIFIFFVRDADREKSPIPKISGARLGEHAAGLEQDEIRA
jgi:hypothetical protein